MNFDARLTQINAGLAGIQPVWPALCHEINLLVADLTLALISQNNEETRAASRHCVT
ncbi:MAG: hypothetical protein M3Y65_24755 [Pseudomonadota bacterium]|nr:hypothetical protein [Pseudomonadota bacterium]